MIHTDIGYDAEYRVDDIGSVEPTAKARFDDGHLNIAIREEVEGHSRSHLKE